jgi:hypothetical protein
MAEMTFGLEKAGLFSFNDYHWHGAWTALIVDGSLVPNLELGHIEVRGKKGKTSVGLRSEK